MSPTNVVPITQVTNTPAVDIILRSLIIQVHQLVEMEVTTMNPNIRAALIRRQGTTKAPIAPKTLVTAPSIPEAPMAEAMVATPRLPATQEARIITPEIARAATILAILEAPIIATKALAMMHRDTKIHLIALLRALGAPATLAT